VKAFERRLWMLEYRLRQAEMDTADLLFRTKYAYDSVRQADAEYRRKTEATGWTEPDTAVTISVTFDGYCVLDDTYADTTISQTSALDDTTSGDWYISNTLERYIAGPQTNLGKIVRWRDNGGTGNPPWFKRCQAQFWYNTVSKAWKIRWRLLDATKNGTGYTWIAEAYFDMERTDATTASLVTPLNRFDDSLTTTQPATYTLSSEASFYRQPSTTNATLVSVTNQMGLVAATVTW
jgi:hypothetical protein